MKATATVKYVRITPRKLGLLADAVRGKPVQDAITYLTLSPRRRSAAVVVTAIKSAVANAEQKGIMDLDQLVISQILVNKGPTLKRFMPRAKGAGARILKYSSHLEVAVSEVAQKKKTKKVGA